MERHARLRLSPNQLRSCPQCYSAMVLMAAEPDETETIAKRTLEQFVPKEV